jgi:hypothetical protein
MKVFFASLVKTSFTRRNLLHAMRYAFSAISKQEMAGSMKVELIRGRRKAQAEVLHNG